MPNMYIENQGTMMFFVADPDCTEKKDIFISKCWYISQRIVKENSDIKTDIALADVWINKKMLGVSYADDIEKLL